MKGVDEWKGRIWTEFFASIFASIHTLVLIAFALVSVFISKELGNLLIFSLVLTAALVWLYIFNLTCCWFLPNWLSSYLTRFVIIFLCFVCKALGLLDCCEEGGARVRKRFFLWC